MFNSVKEAQAIIENYIRQTRNTQGFESELGFGRKKYTNFKTGFNSGINPVFKSAAKPGLRHGNLKRIKTKTLVLLAAVFTLIAILSVVSFMIIKSMLSGL